MALCDVSWHTQPNTKRQKARRQKCDMANVFAIFLCVSGTTKRDTLWYVYQKCLPLPLCEQFKWNARCLAKNDIQVIIQICVCGWCWWWYRIFPFNGLHAFIRLHLFGARGKKMDAKALWWHQMGTAPSTKRNFGCHNTEGLNFALKLFCRHAHVSFAAAVFYDSLSPNRFWAKICEGWRALMGANSLFAIMI